jgi:hypothetical protein
MEHIIVTGKVPTPIPAREPVSPLRPKKVSGAVFDLLVEGEKLKATGAFPPSSAPLKVQSSWQSMLTGISSSDSTTLGTDMSFLNSNSQAGQDLFSLGSPGVDQYSQYAQSLLSEMDVVKNNATLAKYLQNPTLAKYALQSFYGNLSGI